MNRRAIWATACGLLMLGMVPPTVALDGKPARPAIGVDGRVDTSALPALPRGAMLPPLPPPGAQKGVPGTGTFVDSQGRSLMYRWVLPEGASAAQPQPVMIYFHGNNTATQQEILDGFFPGVAFVAGQRDLAAVVVASPQTRSPPQENVRQWYDEDELTIQEFLSQRLPTHFAVDTQRIYFMGGSQGTCFLNEFMQSFGSAYRGGFFGGCGCYNTLDATWTPLPTFVDGMKVFVGSTLDDFLLEPSWNGYGFYKYTIGFDTRSELDTAGPHCASHWTQLERALDWFTDGISIPEPAFEPHWARVSANDGVSGLALTADGALWQMRFDQDLMRSTLSRSGDGGANWSVVQGFDGDLRNLSANGASLFVTDPAGDLRASTDGGQSFPVRAADRYYLDVLADGAGALYLVDGAGAILSGGGDASIRTPLADAPKAFLNQDVVAGLANPRIVATDNEFAPGALFVGATATAGLSPVPAPAPGPAFAASWDGGAVFALAYATGENTFQAFRNANAGPNWEALTLPAAFAGYYRFGARISSLAADTVLTHGGYGSSWISQDAGVTWLRLPGLSRAYDAKLVAANDAVFLSDGVGVFRLNLSEADPVGIFGNGFEPVAAKAR